MFIKKLLSMYFGFTYVWTVDYDGEMRLVKAQGAGNVWCCRKICGWVEMCPDGTCHKKSYVTSWVHAFGPKPFDDIEYQSE